MITIPIYLVVNLYQIRMAAYPKLTLKLGGFLMHLDQTLKDLLTKASLFGLLAKRYEYVDPQKHMYYYQKHFYYVMKVEQHYMMLENQMAPSQCHNY